MLRYLQALVIVAAFGMLCLEALTGWFSTTLGGGWPEPARLLVDGVLLPAFGRAGSASVLAIAAIVSVFAVLARPRQAAAPAFPASGAARLSDSDRQLAARMIDGMVAQVKHEQGMVAARKAPRAWVRLIPQVPIRDRDATTFFGGEPLMPATESWPQGESGPAHFLGQVECSTLPRDLWAGLGPRSGSLAFFLDPKTYAPHIRHYTGRLDRRQVPPVGLPDWNSPVVGRFDALGAYFHDTMPAWAFDVVTMTGPQDDDAVARRSDDDPRMARYRNGFDIASAPWRPFDATTLRMVPDAIAGDLTMLGRIRGDGEKRAKRRLGQYEETAATLDAAQRQGWEDTKRELVAYAAIQEAYGKLEAELAALSQQFAAGPGDDAAIEAGLARMAAIAIPEMTRGSEELSYRPISLRAEPQGGGWHLKYVALFEDWAKRLHAVAPEALPPAVEAELARYWSWDSARDEAFAGHVPFGYVHDFDEEAEVALLELQSSNLMNWIWSDVNTLVLTIARSDLAAGRFDRVKLQVSN